MDWNSKATYIVFLKRIKNQFSWTGNHLKMNRLNDGRCTHTHTSHKHTHTRHINVRDSCELNNNSTKPEAKITTSFCVDVQRCWSHATRPAIDSCLYVCTILCVCVFIYDWVRIAVVVYSCVCMCICVYADNERNRMCAYAQNSQQNKPHTQTYFYSHLYKIKMS